MFVRGFTADSVLLPVDRWVGRSHAGSRVCDRLYSPAPPPASCGCGWSPAARGWYKGSWCSRGSLMCWGSERRDPERLASLPQAYLDRQKINCLCQNIPQNCGAWIQKFMSELRYEALLLPPTYRRASPVAERLSPWLSSVVGSPPSTDRFTIRLKVTNSSVWKCPSLTVSVLLWRR